MVRKPKKRHYKGLLWRQNPLLGLFLLSNLLTGLTILGTAGSTSPNYRIPSGFQDVGPDIEVLNTETGEGFESISIPISQFSFKMLNAFKNQRLPSSYIPSDEVITAPVGKEIWIKRFLVEDDSGVLKSMRYQFDDWERRETYAQAWHMEETGLYEPTSVGAKRDYLFRSSLKYFDKRLSGEIRRAEPGSAMESVGKVRSALRPSSTVNIAEKVKVKFKAKVLEGNAFIEVQNPYIEARSTFSLEQNLFLAKLPRRVTAADVNLGKQFKKISLRTDVDYKLMDGIWVASVTKGLDHGFSTRFSSTQPELAGVTVDGADNKVELLYSSGF
ncbi:MAG: hypothetical protein HOE90_13720 [Bacteriovoracaceae bacterium]|nr:hypothetical protein [Bacteriovoracaceae bacterium]